MGGAGASGAGRATAGCRANLGDSILVGSVTGLGGSHVGFGGSIGRTSAGGTWTGGVTPAGTSTFGGATAAAWICGPAATAAGGSAGGTMSEAGSTVGASRVTTRGLIRDWTAGCPRRVRGLATALASPSAAGFGRVRGLDGALAAASVLRLVAAALVRGVWRAAGLIGVPLPGRMVRAGILASGWDKAWCAAPSSTEVLNVAASMPAACSRSRTSFVVRRNFVARSYTRTIPTLTSSSRPALSGRTVAPAVPAHLPGRNRGSNRPLYRHGTDSPYAPTAPRLRNSASNLPRSAASSRSDSSCRKARENTLRRQAFSKHASEGQRYAPRPCRGRGFTITFPAEPAVIRTSPRCS